MKPTKIETKLTTVLTVTVPYVVDQELFGMFTCLHVEQDGDREVYTCSMEDYENEIGDVLETDWHDGRHQAYVWLRQFDEQIIHIKGDISEIKFVCDEESLKDVPEPDASIPRKKFLCAYAYDMPYYEDFIVEAVDNAHAQRIIDAALKAGKFDQMLGESFVDDCRNHRAMVQRPSEDGVDHDECRHSMDEAIRISKL